MTNGDAGSEKSVLLDVRGLKKYFPIRRGILQKTIGHVKAVDDVTFFLNQGETLSLVGESGCGKTTTSRCILRAITPTAGQVLLSDNGEVLDVATLPKSRLRSLRRQMQMIFQDPFSSLNPRMTLLDIVGEPLLVHGEGNAQAQNRPGRGTPSPRGPAAGIHAALPACLLGRPASAHRHRPGPGPESPSGRCGRARLRPGRVGPGPDPEPPPRTSGTSSG